MNLGVDVDRSSWLGSNNVDIFFVFNPAAAGPPRHLPAAGGGIKLPPFTSATISSQREEIEK